MAEQVVQVAGDPEALFGDGCPGELSSRPAECLHRLGAPRGAIGEERGERSYHCSPVRGPCWMIVKHG
jgi:hypothetical protein